MKTKGQKQLMERRGQALWSTGDGGGGVVVDEYDKNIL